MLRLEGHTGKRTDAPRHPLGLARCKVGSPIRVVKEELKEATKEGKGVTEAE